MIDTKVETFTAKGAYSKGLIDAIKSGAAKIEGTFTLSKNGAEFYSPNFTFNDKYDIFHVGRFDDSEDFLEFVELFQNETDNQ